GVLTRILPPASTTNLPPPEILKEGDSLGSSVPETVSKLPTDTLAASVVVLPAFTVRRLKVVTPESNWVVPEKTAFAPLLFALYFPPLFQLPFTPRITAAVWL